MTGEPLLRVAGLGCERDGRVLFRDLEFVLAAGDCLELRGPNGSGKSTLIRAAAGLYPDYAGTIEARQSLYLGHRPGISAPLTAAENLRWYAALGGAYAALGGTGGSVAEALERVGMGGFERVPCQHLSAGQQRRVGLARLLLIPAPLWLLDEPLTALDIAGQGLIRALIVEHCAAGGAALCATHQPLEVSGAATLALETSHADLQDRGP